jgi:hypothetical protein
MHGRSPAGLLGLPGNLGYSQTGCKHSPLTPTSTNGIQSGLLSSSFSFSLLLETVRCSNIFYSSISTTWVEPSSLVARKEKLAGLFFSPPFFISLYKSSTVPSFIHPGDPQWRGRRMDPGPVHRKIHSPSGKYYNNKRANKTQRSASRPPSFKSHSSARNRSALVPQTDLFRGCKVESVDADNFSRFQNREMESRNAPTYRSRRNYEEYSRARDNQGYFGANRSSRYGVKDKKQARCSSEFSPLTEILVSW